MWYLLGLTMSSLALLVIVWVLVGGIESGMGNSTVKPILVGLKTMMGSGWIEGNVGALMGSKENESWLGTNDGRQEKLRRYVMCKNRIKNLRWDKNR